MSSRTPLLAMAFALALAQPILGHETGTKHPEEPKNSTPLPFITETKGPVRLTGSDRPAPGTPLTGSGFWTFKAAKDKVPVPEEAKARITGAHGTLFVDPTTDTVYWGLQEVGWIAFNSRLTRSSVVPQDNLFKKGNLHGADILLRKGRSPLVAAADNNTGEVYLSDTSFQNPQLLKTPNLPPYADGKGYAPTDVAFESMDRLWITDGYGKGWFMPVSVKKFQFEGHAFGGKSFSRTPHGITYDSKSRKLIVSARPEGMIKTFDPHKHSLTAIDGLPTGSTVCDVDVWGDYLLAPCLDGAGATPGPIYIVNLKKKAVVATLRPKADLGYTDAQHIHDACWYVTGKGKDREVYVLYTNWNPGGVGALRLVNVLD